MDCGNPHNNKKICINTDSSEDIVASLEEMVTSSFWPPELNAIAYDELTEYVSEEQVINTAGRTKTLVGSNAYKELVDFRLAEQKIEAAEENIAYVAEFIVSWYA